MSLADTATSTGKVVVVVAPTGVPVSSPVVEDRVQRLKMARQSARLSSADLPILRLDPKKPEHDVVLKQLQIEASDQVQVLICSRQVSGWPQQIVRDISSSNKENLDFLDLVEGDSAVPQSLSENRSEVELAQNSTTEIGLLLLHDPNDPAQGEIVKAFLTELGRYWIVRYGRVNPTPYPLAYYDSSQAETMERVRKNFQEIGSGPTPVACLFLFQRGRPVALLELFPDLKLPASAVRMISASRGRHLADSVVVNTDTASSLPEPNALQLSPDQERNVLLRRLHEAASQLLTGVSDGNEGQNKLSKRALLTIVEETREGVERDAPLSPTLKEAIKDFLAEPLLLDGDSDYTAIQSRCLELGHTLLDATE